MGSSSTKLPFPPTDPSTSTPPQAANLPPDPWLCSSILQKSIRRTDADTAADAAVTLHRLRGSSIWTRLAADADQHKRVVDQPVPARRSSTVCRCTGSTCTPGLAGGPSSCSPKKTMRSAVASISTHRLDPVERPHTERRDQVIARCGSCAQRPWRRDGTRRKVVCCDCSQCGGSRSCQQCRWGVNRNSGEKGNSGFVRAPTALQQSR